MLNCIELQNFKAARSLHLPLSPLTLLAGLNGSGKSTVLQSLVAIRQSYLSSDGSGLQLAGPSVLLGKGRDVLSEGAQEEIVKIAVVEDGRRYEWECKAVLDASLLDFLVSPGGRPGFVSSHFQYLQADRIVPRTFYPEAHDQARRSSFLGEHGEYTADYLTRHGKEPISARRQCPRHHSPVGEAIMSKVAPTMQLQDQVAGWMQHISPGARVRTDFLPRTDEVLLQFQYVGNAEGLEQSYYRATHVGFGLTYSLPILVACLAAPAGALLLIENPEAHLHPRGQAKLGELLGACAADGVQIVVESHSDHVLNGIRLAVRRSVLKADHVRLCYFTRDVGSGQCYVELPSVLPDGQLTNWPEGFFDQWERSLDALLD